MAADRSASEKASSGSSLETCDHTTIEGIGALQAASFREHYARTAGFEEGMEVVVGREGPPILVGGPERERRGE
jgi:hypothetical protein